jgi:hypothetical protein
MNGVTIVFVDQGKVQGLRLFPSIGLQVLNQVVQHTIQLTEACRDDSVWFDAVKSSLDQGD